MPLSAKGKKIMKAMKKEYGAKKGESVFYASRNKGTISGVEKPRRMPQRKNHKSMSGEELLNKAMKG